MASKRNSSGGASTASFSHYNDQGVRERWPVLVYRLQSHRGWEVYSDPDKESAAASASNPSSTAPSSSSSSSGKKTNAAAKSSGKGGDGGNAGSAPSSSANKKETLHATEELTAAPREGCIEVRKMRLRIRLFEQHAPWDPEVPHPRRLRRSAPIEGPGGGAEKDDDDDNEGDNGGDSERGRRRQRCLRDDTEAEEDASPGLDGWNDNSLLVRRRDTLLVTTRRGMGAVVFRFRSSRDCVDFCDRLTRLNREYLAPPPGSGPSRDYDYSGTEDAVASTTTTNGTSRRRHRDESCVVDGMDGRDRSVEDARDVKRRRLRAAEDDAQRRRPPSGEGSSREEGEGASEPATCSVETTRRREEVMSYLVRLAHDEEFRGFVDEIERGLESSEDAAAMLAAFGA